MEMVRRLQCPFRPDVVIINPYTSYVGGDAKDEERANEFLREGLTPLLVKHNCAAINMHHTPKTNYSSSHDYSTSDFMYRGSGCATMTNWARAYLVFEPIDDACQTFKFVAAKRGGRIGWDGERVRYFKHSSNPGILRWERAADEEVEQARKSKKNVRSKEDWEKDLDNQIDRCMEHIPSTGAILKSEFERKVMEVIRRGERYARAIIKDMASKGMIHTWKLEKTSLKRGAAPEGWSRTSQQAVAVAEETPVVVKSTEQQIKEGIEKEMVLRDELAKEKLKQEKDKRLYQQFLKNKAKKLKELTRAHACEEEVIEELRRRGVTEVYIDKLVAEVRKNGWIFQRSLFEK